MSERQQATAAIAPLLKRGPRAARRTTAPLDVRLELEPSDDPALRRRVADALARFLFGPRE